MSSTMSRARRALPTLLLSAALVVASSCAPHAEVHHAPAPVALPVSASAPIAPARPDPLGDAELAYDLTRGPDGSITVEMTFRGEDDGRTEIALPSSWGGQKELYRELVGLAVVSPSATLEAGDAPDRRVVVHRPGDVVTLRYAFAPKPEPTEVPDGNTYRPLVTANWFHFIGHALFATPRWEDAPARRLRLRWHGLPPDAHLANSFGVDEREQRFDRSLSELRHAVYVGGDFRVGRVDVRGKPVFVAMRGRWGFSDEDYLALVGRIVDVERAFFHDDDFDRFLVTLIPSGTGCCSYGGTGLTDSFATFIASNLPVERRHEHLLAHELFHTWNGRRIGRKEPEELVYWFSEGFTDYYANLLLLRSGIETLPQYVAAYDDTLRGYFLSPARNAKNAAVRTSFWSDRAVERLPYQRGAIFAHEWNLKIRSAPGGHSIDDVMRDLFLEAKEHDTVVSDEEIDTLARRYLPGGVAEDLARYNDAGETLHVSKGALGPCVSLSEASIGAFDLGFDEAMPNGTLGGVVPGGPAHRAGVRDGMRVVRSKWSSDPTKPVELTIVEGPKREKRVITYLPQGKRIRVPQYHLDERRYARDPAGCEAFLRGL